MIILGTLKFFAIFTLSSELPESTNIMLWVIFCWTDKLIEDELVFCKRCKKSFHYECIKKMREHKQYNCPNCRFDGNDMCDFDFSNLVIFTNDNPELQHVIYQFYYIGSLCKISVICFFGTIITIGVIAVPINFFLLS